MALKFLPRLIVISGKPSPEITWWIDKDILLDDSYTKTSDGLSYNKLLLESVNRSMLMREITCRASNTNFTHYKEQSVLIDLIRK